MKKFYLLQTFMFFAFALSAQRTGSVNGIIRDAGNGKPTESATIAIDQLQRRTTADSLGQ